MLVVPSCLMKLLLLTVLPIKFKGMVLHDCALPIGWQSLGEGLVELGKIEAFLTSNQAFFNQFNFLNGSYPLLGQTCELDRDGCVWQLSNALIPWATNVDAELEQKRFFATECLHQSFFFGIERCFDLSEPMFNVRQAILRLLDLAAQPLKTPSIVFEKLLSRFQLETSQAPLVNSDLDIQVLQIGTHASLLSELESVWTQYIGTPFAFQFTHISLDFKRCSQAGCTIPSTQHPIFLKLLELSWADKQAGTTKRLHILRVLPELRAAVRDLSPTLAVCSHPPYICSMFIEFARNGGAVVGYFDGVLENMVPADDLGQWLVDFHDMAQFPTVQFAGISAMTSIKIWASTGTAVPIVPGFGLHTGMAYAPKPAAKALIWKWSAECCDNSEELLSTLTKLSAEAGGKLSFDHLRALRARNESDYASIASHRAVIMFPYDLSLLAFFEIYHAAIPIFVPDAVLMSAYVYRGAYSFPYSTKQAYNSRDIPVRQGWSSQWDQLKKLVGLSEADVPGQDYHPYLAMWTVPSRVFWSQILEYNTYRAVQHFQSLADLVTRLKVADFFLISVDMKTFDAEHLQRSVFFWRATMARLLGHAHGAAKFY